MYYNPVGINDVLEFVKLLGGKNKQFIILHFSIILNKYDVLYVVYIYILLLSIEYLTIWLESFFLNWFFWILNSSSEQ